MPIELVSTGSISPLISLDALLLPTRLSDALVIPPHRVPGTIANNDVISATWAHDIIDTPPATTPPSTTPPHVTGTLVAVSPTPDLPRGDWEAKMQADRDFLLNFDLLGDVRTDGTPPGSSQNDATVSAVMSLENAHTDKEICKPSDRPKHSQQAMLDKMDEVMAQWQAQVSKAMSHVQTGPNLPKDLGNLPLTHLLDTMQGVHQLSLNAPQAPVSQPVQNLVNVNMLLQSQIAQQKMAEATSSFMHALDAGDVSVKIIGSPDPFVPLAPPSFWAKML